MDISGFLREWTEIDLQAVVGIMLAAALLMFVIRFGLNAVARILPAKWRFFVLPWIPLCRFLVFLASIALAAPHVIHTNGDRLLAVAGTLALALGFAVKDYVSSVIAGIITLFERAYRVGDWINLGGHFGEVRKIGFRTVHLRTVDDNEIIVPHSAIWTSSVLNATSGGISIQCAVDFYLHPEHDSAFAQSILKEVAHESEFADKAAQVVVAVREILGATKYTVRVYVADSRSQFKLQSDVTVRGKAALAKSGIRPATYVHGMTL